MLKDGHGGKNPGKRQWIFTANANDCHCGVNVDDVHEGADLPCTLIFGYGNDDEYREPSDEDMRRILACVNACAGIRTEDLLRNQTRVHVDLTKTPDSIADYFITGTKAEIVELAKELLTDEGYTVTDKHEG